MPRTRFALTTSNERYDIFIRQLRGIYSMSSEEEFVYEFYFDDKAQGKPDSVVMVRKCGNVILLYTPVVYNDAHALRLYINKEAELNRLYLVFLEDDYEAAIYGNSMRHGPDVKIIKV